MKKKNKQRNVAQQKQTEKEINLIEPKYFFALLVIVLISFIAYSPALHNGFLWDDEYYIQKNPLIHSINLKEFFSRYVLGNYHPLTILTLATEYHFFGLNETGYHTINLLLHLLNVTLVFYAVFLLSDKAGVALVASLLFSIHPLHVESVAWASELKDLLYTFFFLASYIFYLKYLKKFKRKFYFYALLLFVLSLLSKAMAASLPVVLVLTDYFKERKINLKTLLEKVPFFLLAFSFGVVAVFAQKSSGATDVISFAFPQRIVFACYGFITYLFKLLLPVNLCAFYPYPVKNVEEIPFQYYAYVLFFLGLAAYVFYSLRFTRKIIFGLGFFAVTVFLVLQLLPVGGAIMADRYSYIPSIGIFYLAGEGFNLFWNKKFQWTSIILLTAFTLLFSVRTYVRCNVWKNDMTLWNDVISQYQTIASAYYNRGVVFKNEKRYEDALEDFNKTIELKSDHVNAYYNQGIIFYNEKKYEEAISNYSKAIAMKTDYASVYYDRALAEYYSGKKDAACIDLKQADSLGYQKAAEVLLRFCH